MPRYRIQYNNEALFVGPSPASGFHFLSRNGILNNNYTSGTDNLNLVSHLNRVQEVSFDVATQQSEIAAIGNYGSVKRYQSRPPIISLSFSYIQMGVRNEDKIGLYVNFPKELYNGALSSPIFPNNYEVFLLSGFYTSSFNKSKERDYGYPLDYRDEKNIFFAINDYPSDYNARTSGTVAPASYCFAFGNCYLTSYSSKASVGDFAVASCSYTSDNLIIYSSGSGIANPALNPQDYSQYDTVKCVMPNAYESGYVSALMPGDITLNVTSYPAMSGLSSLKGTGQSSAVNTTVQNLGINFTGIEIQSYNLNLNIPRRPVESINYVLPSNRKLTFPIKCQLGLNIIVHDYATGSFYNIFKKEEEYDLSVILRNPPQASVQGIGVRYDLKRAILDSFSYQTSIGSNKVMTLNFSTELSPKDFSKGLFISGLYNSSQNSLPPSALMQENNFYILQEDNSFILI